MSFTFLPSEMMQDLVALSRVGSPFLAGQSQFRIERLAADLERALASDQKEFSWSTATNEPIRLKESRKWKGGTEDYHPLSADIGVDYKCTRIAESNRLYAEGVTVMRIKDAEGENDKVLHFDAEKGGWTENANGTERKRAGHPAFHMQFYGIVNDLPRVPSLIVHPVDVLTWSILELHQEGWRNHVTTTAGRSQLRHIPTRQRTRFDRILERWRQTTARTDYLAIIALQTKVPEPLPL